MLTLEGGPGGIANEGREQQKDGDRLQPPPILAHGLAEAAANDRELRVRHSDAFPGCWGKGQQGYSREHDRLSMAGGT
jgi:hypothetical protein